MLRKVMQWVPITALLLAVTWRSSANHQILLHLLVCTGAIMVVLTLFSIKREIETHVDNRSNLVKQVPVRP